MNFPFFFFKKKVSDWTGKDLKSVLAKMWGNRDSSLLLMGM